MQQTTTIVVADDHHVVRDGILMTLKEHRDLCVVATAANFLELWTALTTTPADVVVLDIGNMGTPPISMVERLLRAWPRLAIIIFSSSVDLAPELMKAGASCYIVKEDLTVNLVTAIRMARRGEAYLSPQATEYLARCGRQLSPQHITEQEFSVLKYLARGVSSEEVATAMSIGVNTVYNYVSILKKKTGSTGRPQLIDWYRRLYGNE